MRLVATQKAKITCEARLVLFFRPPYALQWFLQDALVAQYPIGSLSDAVNYVKYEWASKNGLTEMKQ
jgi:hypothetical protein